MKGVGVWLVGFPPGLDNQSPAPLGGADLDLSSPTTEAKAGCKNTLQANNTCERLLAYLDEDEQLLAYLIERLDPILRDDPPEWKDEARWSHYVSQATEPPPDQLVPFLAELACGNPGGYIARSMAQRAVDYSEDEDRRTYAKPLATALLAENCEGAKGLSKEMRTELENLVAATE